LQISWCDEDVDADVEEMDDGLESSFIEEDGVDCRAHIPT
jgi:hypothetical protein